MIAEVLSERGKDGSGMRSRVSKSWAWATQG